MKGDVEEDEHEGERILLRGHINDSELIKYTVFMGGLAAIALLPLYIVLLPFIIFAVRTSVASIEVFLTCACYAAAIGPLRLALTRSSVHPLARPPLPRPPTPQGISCRVQARDLCLLLYLLV